MLCMTRRLEGSVAARWRERIAGVDERQRSWKTRVGYYRAVSAALSESDSPEIDVRDIIHRHRDGKQSTLYSVAGKGELLAAYHAHSGSIRGVGDLIGSEPVVKLIAETKVWSFWPFRNAWVREVDVRFPSGDLEPAQHALVRTLRQWHDTHPKLGASLDGLPPLCAVEDLIVLSRLRFSADQAVERLLAPATDAVDDAPTAPAADLDGPPCRWPVAPPHGDGARRADHVGRLNRAIDLLRQAGLAEGPVIELLGGVVRDLAGNGQPK